MPKCSNCKFGTRWYDIVGDKFYWECGVDHDMIREDIAEDNSKPCEFYVEHYLHNNSTERA